MSELSVYPSGGVIARDSRRTGRGISRVHSDGQIRQAAVDVELDVALSKENAITVQTLGSAGAIGRVGQAENTVVLGMPNLSGRITPLADRHALLTYEVLDELAYRMRGI